MENITVNGDLRSKIIIYSPLMAISGYFLILARLMGGAPVSIALAGAASAGAFLFLNYLREKNRFWWVGIIYPLLLVLIITLDIFSVTTSGNLYGPGMTPGRLSGILYLLIAPVSLFFFAAMTPEFRKIMRIPILFAAIIGLCMVVPVYDELSNAYFPPNDGKIVASDVTGGFIIFIMCGVYGLPVVGISGIIMGLKLSQVLRSELLPEQRDSGSQ